MSSSGDLGAISQLLANGEASGGQAQFGIFLQLIQRIVTALETLTPSSSSPFTVYPWTGGNLNIAAAFPNVDTGTFMLDPLAPGPMTVTLPASNGPWLIADGSGFCSPTNQITIVNASGTVMGGADFYFVKQRQSGIFVLNTNDYQMFSW